VYISFFGNSPTGQTPERILALDGSKDAFSHKDVFWGFKKLKLTVNPFMLPNVKFWQKKKILAENALQ